MKIAKHFSNPDFGAILKKRGGQAPLSFVIDSLPRLARALQHSVCGVRVNFFILASRRVLAPAPKVLGLRCWDQNASQIQILRHLLKKRGSDVGGFEISRAGVVQRACRRLGGSRGSRGSRGGGLHRYKHPGRPVSQTQHPCVVHPAPCNTTTSRYNEDRGQTQK